jgi:hypothetical protein
VASTAESKESVNGTKVVNFMLETSSKFACELVSGEGKRCSHNVSHAQHWAFYVHDAVPSPDIPQNFQGLFCFGGVPKNFPTKPLDKKHKVTTRL